MEEPVEPVTRVRMGVKTTAKGTATLDVTSEASTVDETAQQLDTAIKAYRKVLADNGIKEAVTE